MVNKSYVTIGRGSYGLGEDNTDKYNQIVWDTPSYNRDGVLIQPKLIVGNFCSMNASTKIYLGGNHRYDWVTTYPFHVRYLNNGKYRLPNHDGGDNYPGYPHSNGDVIIGNDVWFGEKVTVMSGVTIGDGAVIATNSHVVKDVAPYSISGGNPTKHIKYRFDPETVRKLLEIKWWDMDEDILQELLPFLYSKNINAFIEEVKKY
jgi:acetyltransferase-like isoleucine patch superfamily enzyme